MFHRILLIAVAGMLAACSNSDGPKIANESDQDPASSYAPVVVLVPPPLEAGYWPEIPERNVWYRIDVFYNVGCDRVALDARSLVVELGKNPSETHFRLTESQFTLFNGAPPFEVSPRWTGGVGVSSDPLLDVNAPILLAYGMWTEEDTIVVSPDAESIEATFATHDAPFENCDT